MSFYARFFARGALDNLNELRLSGNQISDAGLSALAKAITPGPNGKGALASLERVVLDGNPGDSAPVDKALRERKK